MVSNTVFWGVGSPKIGVSDTQNAYFFFFVENALAVPDLVHTDEVHPGFPGFPQFSVQYCPEFYLRRLRRKTPQNL